MKTRKEIFKSLNTNLLAKQKVSKEQLKRLISLYQEREKTFELLSEATELKDIQKYSLIWTEIEFCIQEHWNFPRSYSFHRFWNNPHCTCPIMDNEDRWGIDSNVMNCDCPIHGNKEIYENIYNMQLGKYTFIEKAEVENFLKDIV